MLYMFVKEEIHVFIYTVDIFGVHPFLLPYNIIFYIYHNLLIHSHVYWHLVISSSLLLTNNTDLKIFVHVLSYASVRVSLGFHQP